jgi:hypothetical protein
MIKPWVMRLVWPAAYTGEKTNAYKVLTQKPEGKISLGRLWHRWEDIKTDLKERQWKSVEWINLVQDSDQWQALVNVL